MREVAKLTIPEGKVYNIEKDGETIWMMSYYTIPFFIHNYGENECVIYLKTISASLYNLKYVKSCEISYDNVEWTEKSFNAPNSASGYKVLFLTLQPGQRVYIKSDSAWGRYNAAGTTFNYLSFYSENTTDSIEVGGNVMSLIKGDDYFGSSITSADKDSMKSLLNGTPFKKLRYLALPNTNIEYNMPLSSYAEMCPIKYGDTLFSCVVSPSFKKIFIPQNVSKYYYKSGTNYWNPFNPATENNIESIVVDKNNTVFSDGNGSNCLIMNDTILLSGCNISVIPDGITSLEMNSFNYCKSMTSISLPATVINIKQSAFQGCSSLTDITVNATVPPTLHSWAFNSTALSNIYVPAESVEAYQSAAVWSSYAAKIQAIPE